LRRWDIEYETRGVITVTSLLPLRRHQQVSSPNLLV